MLQFIIPAAIAALGSIREGNMASSAAKYNAKIAKQQAALSQQRGTLQIEQQGREARAAIGRQLAAGAQSGLSLTGSNLDMLRQSLEAADADALDIRYGATLQALGYQNEARAERWRGSQAQIGGYLNAAGQILGGANSYLRAGGTFPWMQQAPLTTGDFARMDRRSPYYGG